MPQLTRCPHCSKPLQIPDGAGAQPMRCPLCQQLFQIRPISPPPVQAPVPVAAPAAARTNNGSAPRPAPAAVGKTPPAPPAKAPALRCPACQSRLSAGVTACPDCGFVLQSEEASLEAEADTNLCPNTACGVANPPGEQVCQRCGSPLPMPAGTLVQGRYRIERLLAIGGFAAVYYAIDTRQRNRPVALKDMLCPDPKEFSIRLNFFHREAEILQELAGFAIVPRLYDFIHQGKTVQLVMEFIPGQDLLKILETSGNKPFPLEQVVEWGKSICEVLTHMHNHQPPLVHRDLKPDNIMLLDDGRSIRMIDFGTARDVGRSDKTKLAAKTRVYTEGYAPPEQIIGKPEVRSDLFALAGTLYHLATGKTPEGHYTARELEAQLAAPNGALPAGQRWFFELIRINLAEDVNDRYFSCAEFRTDLERRQVTKETACLACGVANPVRQPYCQKCAAPLTQPTPPCGHCGKVNRMGSRCCIYCGCRLR